MTAAAAATFLSGDPTRLNEELKYVIFFWIRRETF